MSFLGPVGHSGIVVGGRRRRQHERRLRGAGNDRAFIPSAAGRPLGLHRHRYAHPSFSCRMTIASEPLSAAPGVKADTTRVSALFPERFRPFLTELDDGSVASRDVPNFHARRTKIVCTIGPATASYAELLKMAALGMNVVRLNMSHGDYTFHSEVIAHVRRINTESPFVLATMLDIGSLDSVRLGQMPGNEMALSPGDRLIITTRHQAEYPDTVTEVSDDAFMAVVQSGDVIEVRGNADGSMVLLRVADVTTDGTDADCVVMEGGTIRSRAPIGVRGKSLRSPILNAEEMERDLEFAVQERVEAVALSFVEAPEHVWDVKRQLKERGASNTAVVAKIESAAALDRLDDITEAADAVMIARGDLGAAVRYDMVPYWQQRIAQVCRAHGKPCIVSTHFLESMVLYPTPTRAEVTDISEAVKQRVDALMLTTETASGKYPLRALSLMSTVALRVEGKLAEDCRLAELPPPLVSHRRWARGISLVAERVCSSATTIAERLNAAAIICFTQRGFMANLLARCRPLCPIYAFTNSVIARNKMSVLFGVRPFRILFDGDPEVTVQRAIDELLDRQALTRGDRVVVVADILGGKNRATEEEMLLVFGGLDPENRGYISRELLRKGLREMGLKAGDDVELETWLDEYDERQGLVEECFTASDVDACVLDRQQLYGDMEGEADGAATRARADAGGNGVPSRARRLQAEIDYAAFRQLVQDSAEIVQTIQFRRIE